MIGDRILNRLADKAADEFIESVVEDNPRNGRYGNPILFWILGQVILMVIKKILENRDLLAKFEAKMEDLA